MNVEEHDIGLNPIGPDHWLHKYGVGFEEVESKRMTDVTIKSNGVITGRFSCDEVIISNGPNEYEEEELLSYQAPPIDVTPCKNCNTTEPPKSKLPEGFSQFPLNQLAWQINKWAQEKGWNDKLVEFGDMISLFHTELSEAYEEYRNGHEVCEVYTQEEDFIPVNGYKFFKPLGIPTELADLIIRILHYCGYCGIDIETILTQKMEYNYRRSYRHGNKVT